MNTGRQTLLFDADDTLWENYIYFDRAIADFITFLDHKHHSPEEVREKLNCCETENIARMGYGLPSFELSLVHCFEDLAAVTLSAEQHARIRGFAHGIASQPVELLDRVAESLAVLQHRHELVLVTKGIPLEQLDKLRRSGLERYFSTVEVLAEKSPESYAALLKKHGWPRETCWMIGNSPKSDVQAPLAAGLNVVHIPHRQTWVLEHCEIAEPAPPQRLVKLQKFADLSGTF
jgi:putative hydrolase of the HAD superfamily